jgi:hypothetical protein
MGKSVSDIAATFADGQDTGSLQWETPKLIFRGASRRVFEGAALASVRAEGGDLVLADGSRFALGEPFAGRWAEAIANPPGRLDKLGVKPGMRVAVIAVDDADFLGELIQITQPVNEFSELDIVFLAVDTSSDIDAMSGCVQMLAERGAIWIVSRKGKAATIKDVEVIAAGRALGLADTKVCSFSPTHTALRFVRRKG